MTGGEIYFRAEVDGRWRSVCLDDLTELSDEALALMPAETAAALVEEMRRRGWWQDLARLVWKRRPS